MDTGAAIRRARTAAGLSQRELARRAGTSQATVAMYESGRKVPSVTTLDRLLDAAGARLHVVEGAAWPADAALAKRGARLADVLGLADALPHAPPGGLRYPRLPAGP